MQEEGVRLFRRMQMSGLQKQVLDPVEKDYIEESEEKGFSII